MAKTGFSGPLVVGGKQLTALEGIAPLEAEAEAGDIADKVNEIIEKLTEAGIIEAVESDE